MKMKLVLLVLALQSMWLLGTVAVQERALAAGRAVLLEAHRVDPRDLLRGDHLILSYNVSEVPGPLFSPPVPNNLVAGTTIYVAVARGTNGFYEAVRASTNKFAPATDQVLIAGQSGDRWWNATNSVHVIYGIENYYVAENTGNPTGKLTAEVAVSTAGRARIKEVFLDGQPYAAVMRAKSR